MKSIDNKGVVEEVITYLLDVIKLPADEVLDKTPAELSKKQRVCITWAEGKEGRKAVPIDKLKAAEILLKYLSVDIRDKKPENGVVIVGEGEIEE